MKRNRNELTAADFRHLISALAFKEEGVYDHITGRFTYPRTIRKKLCGLLKRRLTRKDER